MSERDVEVDVLVVGSGAAAFATALGAVDEGLSVLMIESTDKWGGSSAMSGGGMWLPNSPLMQRAGVGDSREEALAYMEATIGEAGRASSRERKEAFVDGVADVVLTAEKHGVVFARDPDYPDYYPEQPGGKIGRSAEGQPFDSKRLGDWWATSRASYPIPLKSDDVWLLGRSWVTFDGMLRGARFVARGLTGLVTGKRLVGLGSALMCALHEAVVIRGGAQLWLNAPLEELTVLDGRVAGARTSYGGSSVVVRARRGVMIASGGFEHNVDWRREHHGIDGAPSGNPGNLGRGIELARQAGAALELMDDAWWGASLAAPPGGVPAFVVGERSFPYSMIVDAQGDRFANESASYVDLGHLMLERRRALSGTRPDSQFWMICDARHARRYLRTFAVDPKAMKAYVDGGIVVKAPTLEALAGRLDMEPVRLRASVERFNGFARAGVDGDFGRGNSAYDRYYSDPTVHPNPCLGPIEKGPFTAYRLVIGDLGTNGGVLTDVDGRALRDDGSVIEGLYAAGNASASVMGRTYPGAGATIGPATVFGLRAARRMARAD